IPVRDPSETIGDARMMSSEGQPTCLAAVHVPRRGRTAMRPSSEGARLVVEPRVAGDPGDSHGPFAESDDVHHENALVRAATPSAHGHLSIEHDVAQGTVTFRSSSTRPATTLYV